MHEDFLGQLLGLHRTPNARKRAGEDSAPEPLNELAVSGSIAPLGLSHKFRHFDPTHGYHFLFPIHVFGFLCFSSAFSAFSAVKNL